MTKLAKFEMNEWNYNSLTLLCMCNIIMGRPKCSEVRSEDWNCSPLHFDHPKLVCNVCLLLQVHSVFTLLIIPQESCYEASLYVSRSYSINVWPTYRIETIFWDFIFMSQMPVYECRMELLYSLYSVLIYFRAEKFTLLEVHI
jgi:hypothetical protein